MNLLEKLKDFGDSAAIPMIGITDCRKQTEIQWILQDRRDKGYTNSFEAGDIDTRISPSFISEFCRSIVVIGIPYELKNKHQSVASYPGKVTNMAWEFDYHRVLKEKMAEVYDFLESELGAFDHSIHVDTSPLVDRHMGYLAGIGCYGKNNFLINSEYGTAFYIGYILADIPSEVFDNGGLTSNNGERLQPIAEETGCTRAGSAYTKEHSKMALTHCSICCDCNKCVQACPTGALMPDQQFDPNRCISFLTQKKGSLTYDEMGAIGRNLYGCDICQLVCPYNEAIVEIPEAYRRHTVNEMDLFEFLMSSNGKLRKNYRDTGFMWRGPKILKRNALIVIGNYRKKENIPFLEAFAASCPEDLIEYVIYALYLSGFCLKSEKIYGFFQVEHHNKVFNEIERIFKYMKFRII